jgi:hypothetical protein
VGRSQKAKAPATKGGKKTGKKQLAKFVIDCWQPVDDKVLDMATFEKFLSDRIKVRLLALLITSIRLEHAWTHLV